ncbi:TlpA family protein disulfide reductase [Martelella lutilitoris]|uniref:TlpA family protein disulfide reductase n=1 Tax=Martelella lutilitoris TaxID=2583532 RepID=A0A5C4JPD6_9HYPH|nr:TlpA disulfide reductase family protein [Martelella lutilitoris]TNB46469.1 TlpA family protein disulfide reductase [Martelella lutilitoris]
MTKKSRKSPISARLVLIALVAGLIAGAVAVYVKNTFTGNGASELAAADQCEMAVETAAALKPLAHGEVAAFIPAETPRPMQNLAFNSDAGETSLSAFKGKTVLMNLWATWCVPCREEMPALDELEAEMGGDDFEVVAVNIDTGSDEKPKKFLDEIGISSLAFYRDGTMGVFNTLKKDGLAFGLPSTILIDENGCLLGSMNGPAEWASDDAKALVGAAIGR